MVRQLKRFCTEPAGMTESERKRWRESLGRIAALLQEKGVQPVEPLFQRVEEMLVAQLCAKRSEWILLPSPSAQDEEQPATALAALEGLLKVRERLRRAVRELEDYCARAGTPIDQGLADQLRPFILKTRAVLGGGVFAGQDEGDMQEEEENGADTE